MSDFFSVFLGNFHGRNVRFFFFFVLSSPEDVSGAVSAVSVMLSTLSIFSIFDTFAFGMYSLLYMEMQT